MKFQARSMFWLLGLLWFANAPASLAQTANPPVKAPATTPAVSPTPTALPDSISAAEFSRLSRELSEEGGYFFSDNFTSNETSYLHIVAKLRQHSTTGGAYLGVGPEQNFTYIAKLRPRIAFLLDIRRQAIIQHLMYKAIFQLSPTRPQFLAFLLSRPLPKEKPPAANAPLNELVALLVKTSADEKAYTANLATLRKTIVEEFQFPLTERDVASLEYIYKSFRVDGLEIAFRMDGAWSTYFPSLQEMLTATDLRGQQGNFLANVEDFEFVRGMHTKNLIIPVVGDFAGQQAIAGIGAYLRKHGLSVSAYYTSNVEQYLFDNDVFNQFANNVRKLPLTDKSLFIRAVFNMRYSHPARLPGHLSTTVLQQMPVFLKDFDAGQYKNYYDLIVTNYIAADKP